MEAVKLKNHQVTGVKFLGSKRKGILGDKMGLGKTLTALYVTFKHPELKDADKRLIVCSLNAMSVWKAEIKKWFPQYADLIIPIRGNKQQRERIWAEAGESGRKGIWLVTYETVRQDIDVVPKVWDHIIGDEAHKIRNRKTQVFKAFKKLKAPVCHLLTGTPASNGPQDLWTMLNYLQPKVYTSYWRFVNTFCIVEDNGWGKEIVGPKNEMQLKNILDGIMLAREGSDQLPPKVRSFIPIELDKKTEKLYESMQENLITVLNEETGNLAVAPGILSKITKMRQLLACPRLLDDSLPIGSGLEFVISHMSDEELRYGTVFSTFPAAFKHWREECKSRRIPSYELVGGTDMDIVQERIDKFRQTGGIMFCSIKFAQSFSIEFCNTGYVIGYDWDPQNNYQAEDRLRRLTTIGAVNLYYLRYEGFYDDDVIDVLDGKQRNVRAVYNTPERLLELLTPKKREVRPVMFAPDEEIPF